MEPDEPERNRLDARELACAEMLVAGIYTFEEIGDAIGVSKASAFRMSRRPHVAAHVEEVCAEAQRMARRRAVGRVGKAIHELYEIGMDDSQPGQVRVSALAKVVDIALPRRSEVTGRDGGPVAVDVQTDVERIRSVAASLAPADLGLQPDPAVSDRGIYDEG